jgi:hypothetical protein
MHGKENRTYTITPSGRRLRCPGAIASPVTKSDAMTKQAHLTG